MEYSTVGQAEAASGLRLVLTAGVPGPWSETAKALFHHHKVPYMPVRQEGGRDNPELVSWTKHRNAPVALYNDEAPRVRWLELLDLAERLGSGASLVPGDRAERMLMIGLINEIAGENGFAWNARLLMLDVSYQKAGDKAYRNPMLSDYQYDPDKIEKTKQSLNDFLAYLSRLVTEQEQRGSTYLIGDSFTAADIYWAYFANLIAPLEASINPMPDYLRKSYELPATLLAPFDQNILKHRDAMFDRHLVTPLDF